VKLQCKECKKEFFLTPYRAKTAKYCSNSCSYKAISSDAKINFTKKRKVKCTFCSKEFFKKQSVIKTNNFCSEQCLGRYYTESGMFAGSNSGTWQGGDINYYGPNWRKQRREARKRDKYICQDCGTTEIELGHELSVHHVIPFRQFEGNWIKANRLSNLISLCEYPCHRKRHSNH
jgi:HNH endonuclease